MIKSFLNKAIFIFLVLGTTFLSGCKKIEGTGGAATIEGKIMLQDYTAASLPNGAPYEGYDQRVYLIYGSGTTQSDECRTSYDGSYRFTGLRTGNYKIFVYSAIVPAPANPPNDEELIEAITITDKKGTVTVETITAKKY